MKNERYRRLISGLFAVGLGAGHGAYAQAQAGGDGAIEEIVVTAQKREETAQTTPISMSVYTSDEIVRKGITDIQSLATADTSLNYSNGGSEGFISIRGVLSKDVTEIGDPTVPVGQDWFFTNRPAQLINSLYDIERIEVLRGPQGTLYGRNATGGVVNIITAKPVDETEASASVELGNYDALNVTGMVNLPLTDRVQLRGAFATRSHEGYRDTTLPLGSIHADGDDEDSQSVRVHVAAQPTDALDILFTVQRTEIGGVGTVALNIPFVPSATIPGDIEHSIPPIGDPTSFALGGPTAVEIQDTVYNLQVGYELPTGMQVTYLGGYSDFEWHQWLPTPGLFTPPDTMNSFFQNEYPTTQNHELRFTSSAEGMFTWQAGLYFFEERNEDLYSAAIADPGSSTATELIAFRFPLTETTSTAAFGQGSFQLTDTLILSAGLRYTDDEKTRTGVLDIPAFDIFGIPQDGSAEFSKTTGHLGLDWNLSDTQLAYAKVDTGYKAGGFTTCNPYGAEEVTAFEVGSKNRLFDNTMLLNFAAFYNDYQDQQVQTFVPASVCVSNSTVQNAGGSEIYGVEADFTALVGPGQVDVAMTWLHARYDDFVAQPGIPAAAGGCSNQVPILDGSGNVVAVNCQLDGNHLPLAPDLTIAAGYEQSWTMGNSTEVTGRIEGKYQSEQYYDPFNYDSTRQSDYGIINAYLDFERDNWRIAFWGRNLTDKEYFASAQEFYTIGTYQYAFAAPRTYGVRLEIATP